MTLKDILSSIATKFDKQIEHDVATLMLERSEKISEKILDLLRVQATFYNLLGTKDNSNRRQSIETKIDMLDMEILKNQAMIYEMRSSNVPTEADHTVVLLNTPQEDNEELCDDESMSSSKEINENDHIGMVKLSPKPMKSVGVNVNDNVFEVTIPNDYDEVSCLHQSEANCIVTYSQYESPSLI